jgi:hypothetical protein
MLTCSRCAKEFEETETFCPHCGTFNESIVLGSETMQLDRNTLGNLLESISEVSALLHSDDTLVLSYGQSQRNLSLHSKVIFGRDMSALGGGDLVDLEHFVGHQAGISRRHAEMICTANGDVILTDLASSNGTFINGQKLTPLRPYTVQDGDELVFGTLHIRFEFADD